MKHRVIITINREYGSNGRVIGIETGKRLGIPVHGDDIVGLASEYSGIDENHFQRVDEKPTDSLLFMIANNTFSMLPSVGSFQKSLSSDRLFNVQSDVIKNFADQGSCIIIGRCGNYILRDDPDMISVFITADMDYKTETVMKRENVKKAEAEKRIKAMERRRTNYYGYYSGRDWRACSSYDLVINSGKLGEEKTADLICDYARIKLSE